MPFRIAIGSCRCADGVQSRNPLVRELCSRIVTCLEQLRSSAPEVLGNLPGSSTNLERISGRQATLTTYRDTLQSGDALIVVQGFLRSWRFPTYIGSAGVGYMYAEGILVGANGQITEPDEELVWPFR
jgi:hypothetical protein